VLWVTLDKILQQLSGLLDITKFVSTIIEKSVCDSPNLSITLQHLAIQGRHVTSWVYASGRAIRRIFRDLPKMSYLSEQSSNLSHGITHLIQPQTQNTITSITDGNQIRGRAIQWRIKASILIACQLISCAAGEQMDDQLTSCCLASSSPRMTFLSAAPAKTVSDTA
jgi:hypothetical protein